MFYRADNPFHPISECDSGTRSTTETLNVSEFCVSNSDFFDEVDYDRLCIWESMEPSSNGGQWGQHLKTLWQSLTINDKKWRAWQNRPKLRTRWENEQITGRTLTLWENRTKHRKRFEKAGLEMEARQRFAKACDLRKFQTGNSWETIGKCTEVTSMVEGQTHTSASPALMLLIWLQPKAGFRPPFSGIV